jgi:putative cell wall-binding protein
VWPRPLRIAAGPLVLDGHGAPALFKDGAGYLHAIFGGHNSALLHVVSKRPLSITSGWRTLGQVWPSGTYPQPVRLGGGKWLVFYRQGGNPGGLAYRSGREDGAGGIVWNAGSTVLLPQKGPYMAPGTYNWYGHFEAGRNGSVLATFVLRTPEALEWVGRHNVYYAWRDRAGVWRNARGDRITFPITPTSANAQCLVYYSGSQSCNEMVVKDSGADPLLAQPQPLVQFNVGTGRWVNSVRWKFARWTGGRWTLSEIVGTDHNFDSGTFDPQPNGTVDSYVVCGSGGYLLYRKDQLECRGGTLVRFRSTDGGASWRQVQQVSPKEDGSLFGDPQLVEGHTATSTIVFTEWTNDYTAFFQRIFLWGTNGFVKRSIRPTMERLAGADRIATSLAVSRRAFPERSDAVVLATGYDFPDALAAAPLAQALHGPVLLVPSWGLPDSVLAEVRRLKPARAVVLGSTKVMSERAVTQRQQAGVPSVERIGGIDRYQTAEGVARELRDVLGPLQTAVFVDGRNFPDALSVAPLAAYDGFPILLARGTTTPAATRTLLGDLGVKSTLVIGSEDVVAAGFASGLPAPTRLAGQTRYDTSAEVARYALSHGLLPYRLTIASGADFPDALAGTMLAAHTRAPMLLTEPSRLSTAPAAFVSETATRTIQAFVLGGEDVLRPPAVQTAATLLDADIR